MVYIKIAWRVVKSAVVEIRTLAQMLPPRQLTHYTNQQLKTGLWHHYLRVLKIVKLFFNDFFLCPY